MVDVSWSSQPENILCLTKTGNRVKIIDFGLARVHSAGVDTRVLFGTPEFMAPEVAQYEPIDFATDMWSVGVICYVLYACSLSAQIVCTVKRDALSRVSSDSSVILRHV